MKNKNHKLHTLVVCNLDTVNSPFLDNIVGKCRMCKRAIHYRPHAPRKASKICIECFQKYYGDADILYQVTDESREEIINILTKN